jgi:sugar PTS system EIIA component
MTTTLRVLAPVPGRVVALADVPDPVFAEAMVGPGLAIEPLRAARVTAVAPADGVVGALHPHAFALECEGDRSVLVHLGIDTVGLKGLGFVLHVAAGDVVRAGDRVVTWSPVDVAAAGLATVCPVVALQADGTALTPCVETGADVAAGDPLLDWA